MNLNKSKPTQLIVKRLYSLTATASFAASVADFQILELWYSEKLND